VNGTLPSAAAISIKDLHLAFGSLTVLTGLSLDVLEGQTVGIVGPNGAGKTSLLNCINRVYAQQRGHIDLFGERIDRKRPDQVAELGLARTFQATTAFRDIKVADLVLLGRHVLMKPPFVSYFVGIPLLTGYEARERRRCMELIDFVGLANFAQRTVGELPYGLAKLTDLARALAMEPRVLLLDEPASGLGSEDRLKMAEMLRRVQSELKVTQVIVEHDMTLVYQVCDRVVVLKNGTTVADGPPAEVLTSPEAVEALLGV
jgi:branched-chain amino acid transport system ATP-binding protein